MEQLDLFQQQNFDFTPSLKDVMHHRARMAAQAKNKGGAIQRLIRARYDDIMAEKIAHENILLRKENEELKAMLKDKSA
ncbi:MAG: hypothetical protein R6V36_08650 [Psychroflexus sp.]